MMSYDFFGELQSVCHASTNAITRARWKTANKTGGFVVYMDEIEGLLQWLRIVGTVTELRYMLTEQSFDPSAFQLSSATSRVEIGNSKAEQTEYTNRSLSKTRYRQLCRYLATS